MSLQTRAETRARRLVQTLSSRAPSRGSSNRQRSRPFRQNPHGRYWWNKYERTDYVPPLYTFLSTEEWKLIEDWYAETDAHANPGEMNVPPMSLVQGLVMGNGVNRIVQLGHFFGYSSLLLGMMLRHMRGAPGLVSIDIDPSVTDFTQRWVDRAGLGNYVRLIVGDSAAETSYDQALALLGGKGPELLVIDSSHQYAHTLRELDLWVPRLPIGSIVVLHDTSQFATSFDSTGEGGVRRALEEWVPEHPEVQFINLNINVVDGTDGNTLAYKDGCGVGIMQRVS
jgi:predicted O-methyltransferase YrrM